jgi:hypothetical protein
MSDLTFVLSFLGAIACGYCMGRAHAERQPSI